MKKSKSAKRAATSPLCVEDDANKRVNEFERKIMSMEEEFDSMFENLMTDVKKINERIDRIERKIEKVESLKDQNSNINQHFPALEPNKTVWI